MRTLLDSYQNFPRSKWDYYDDQRTGHFLSHPFLNRPNNAFDHHQFVRDYFMLSGKNEVLRQFGPNPELTDERAYHTNSVFFLGLLIRENTSLRYSLFNEKRTRLGYPIFPFLWFLSILFHDYGMQMEEYLNDFPKLVDIDNVFAHYDIHHSLLDLPPIKGNEELTALMRPYYKYRVRCGKIDHGIVGGLYLYDRLIKIRRQKILSKDRELSWHYSLEKKYALAATVVACHNIWTIPEDNDKAGIYSASGLDYLIQPAFKEITAKGFPLLFIFGIADTMDPVKLYMRHKKQPEEILSSIGISFTKNSLTFNNLSGSLLDFSLLADQADGLPGWICVECHKSSDSVRIQFK